jgi:hypothetical protein
MRILNRVACCVALIVAGAVASAEPVAADAIPYFARQYGLSCSACHVQPPKLNEFGETFRRNGYRLDGRERRRTVPLAVWASARSDAFRDEAQVRDALRAYVNKLELISGGHVGHPAVSYFVEWRPVSLEAQRRDGEVRLRDRSGRFEDLFVAASAGRLAVTLGQFRQIDQVDVSLRLGLSEPLALAASLPGRGEGNARQRSLRGFAPAGRSPSLRVAWEQPLAGGGWSWTTSAALPVPGELSIPLTAQARVEASNELEWRRKGVVLESFVRRGLLSVGAHAFYDDDERYLLQGVTTGSRGPFYWTGVAGVERFDGASRRRWSVEGELAPHYFLALGGRVEDRTGDGARRAVVPYLRTQFPGTRYTMYLAVEQRLQRGAYATFVELGSVF